MANVKVGLGCIPCIMKQALNVARLSTGDEDVQREILNAVMAAVRVSAFDASPAEESNVAYVCAAAISGNADPYRREKHEFNQRVLSMYDDLAATVAHSEEPLRTAVKLAAAGNTIDLGIGHRFDLEADLATATDVTFAIDDFPRFADEIACARRLLYVADNAGEIVLDKLLIETMGVPEVTVAVRQAPLINDATMVDAREIALDDVATIITNGYDGIGAPLARVGGEFRDAWEGADVVVSKGQANFETLDDAGGNVFFLLKAKCEYVADELGVSFGQTVLIHASRLARG